MSGVEGEFAKAEVDVVVRVGLVEDAGLDEPGARVEEESQRRADREPDPGSGETGDGGVDDVAWEAERDCAVGGKCGAGGRRGGWVVGCLCIGL